MKNRRRICTVLIICILCCLTITRANANVLQTEKNQTLDGISSCRRIASYDSPIELNEYRIAYRTVSYNSNQGFHFIIQLENGAWAGKNDYRESKYFYSNNPSITPEMWDYYYPATLGTHYFAISRNLEK